MRAHRPADSYLIESKALVATLQTALDRSTARIRELETTVGTLNARLALANECADEAEQALAAERARRAELAA